MANPPVDPQDLNTPPNPNPNPDIPPTPDDSGVPAWQQLVFESNSRANKAEQRIAELERMQTSSTPPTPVISLEQGDSFNDPEKFARRINADVAAQVAPLNNFIQNIERMNRLRGLLNQIKVLRPQFAQQLTTLEPYIIQQYEANPSLQPDGPTIENTITFIVGKLTMQGAFAQPAAPQVPQNPNNLPVNPPVIPPRQPNSVVPPSMPPSAPILPPQVPAALSRQLNETEKRVARESGLSDAEFLELQDATPDQAKAIWTKIRSNRNGGR